MVGMSAMVLALMGRPGTRLADFAGSSTVEIEAAVAVNLCGAVDYHMVRFELAAGVVDESLVSVWGSGKPRDWNMKGGRRLEGLAPSCSDCWP